MIDLVPDILSEILSRLPREINQKFTFAQVSHYWREVALQDHLFWSSFTGGPSKQECYRVPMLLERCGNAPLHVELHLNSGHIVDWHAHALKALFPYATRIETLALRFWVYSTYSLPDSTTGPLLNSGLEFPALRTLRLEGPTWGRRPFLLFSAPGLRTLDVERYGND
ncbi:hypothetical protein R3P38DRAFT_1033110 [Favolaschia claudopus]|uniref:F-box domain-containing protein n=1 Tax=Favolaschia claudopus TaxID=2862362 RepID=A0AAW0BIV8_9AGAR